jgi:hypothetical protein
MTAKPTAAREASVCAEGAAVGPLWHPPHVSDLNERALSYEMVVAEYFVGMRGAGLMLSPLDLEQVRSWERRGLPVAIVCRGLRRGFESSLQGRPPGSPPPRAVRAYRLAVEDEWRAYRSGRVGDSPGPPDEREAARARLDAARAFLARGASQSGPCALALRQAAQVLAEAPESPTLAEVDALLGTADAALLRGWLRGLSHPERSALGRRCRLRAGPRPPSTRPAAYRDALRAHLGDAAAEAGLLRLRGSV